jgi:Protein of unknown function (DUF3105)
MASRKEQKERLRQQRLEQEQAAAGNAKRRMYVGYGVAGLLTVAVVIGLVVVITSSGGSGGGGAEPASAHIDEASGTPAPGDPVDTRSGTPPPAIKQADLQKAAKEAGCVLHLNLRNEGQTHLKPGSPTPNYKTNPPTSGNHIYPPYQTADGAYRKTPDSIRFVHSLEHGRIEIQYSSRLLQQDQLALKGVFDDDPNGMLMFPNDKMPYEVATTAWTQLMGCKTYKGQATLDAIRDFRDQYRGNGPEAIPL